MKSTGKCDNEIKAKNKKHSQTLNEISNVTMKEK